MGENDPPDPAKAEHTQEQAPDPLQDAPGGPIQTLPEVGTQVQLWNALYALDARLNGLALKFDQLQDRVLADLTEARHARQSAAASTAKRGAQVTIARDGVPFVRSDGSVDDRAYRAYLDAGNPSIPAIAQIRLAQQRKDVDS